jgi:hypothetical protein
MQEVQKAIVKSGQVLVTTAKQILQATKQQLTLDPQDYLGLISDALSFIGHAGYQTSLKQCYLLKPELSKCFQLCASSAPITTCYLAMICQITLMISLRLIE